MDRQFLITQLINAVLIIVTTIIVTRVTVKGSFGISQNTKERLKTIAINVIAVIVNLFNIVWVARGLFIALRVQTPITRREVMHIAIYVSTLAIYFVLI